MTLSSGWKRYWVVYQTNSAGGSSTDKYMLLRNDNDMASCDVCGVMIERGNKASEWSASPLDAAAESSAAQSTANTANTNATNANNRVGNLETCIKMTSDGVRVGKISNSNFTGYSALVNSAGSFDVLDSSGNPVSRFSASSIELGKNSKTSTVSMCGGVVKFSSNSGGTNLSIDTQDQGPVTINKRELGLIGMASIFSDTGSGAVAPTGGAWTTASMQSEYMNTKGATAVTTLPYGSESNAIRINVSAVYLISMSGKIQNCQPGDICHVALGTGTGNKQIVMEGQINVNGDWDFISHTECRVLSPGLYHYYYRCEQGGGSILSGGFVTMTLLGFRY